MRTTLNRAVGSYLRAKTLSRGTRNEYFSTLRKWDEWGRSVSIEELRRKDVREFLDWVHERALADEGTNPGRTVNKAREHLKAVLCWAWEQELIDSPPRFPKPRAQRDVAGERLFGARWKFGTLGTERFRFCGPVERFIQVGQLIESVGEADCDRSIDGR